MPDINSYKEIIALINKMQSSNLLPRLASKLGMSQTTLRNLTDNFKQQTENLSSNLSPDQLAKNILDPYSTLNQFQAMLREIAQDEELTKELAISHALLNKLEEDIVSMKEYMETQASAHVFDDDDDENLDPAALEEKNTFKEFLAHHAKLEEQMQEAEKLEKSIKNLDVVISESKVDLVAAQSNDLLSSRQALNQSVDALLIAKFIQPTDASGAVKTQQQINAELTSIRENNKYHRADDSPGVKLLKDFNNINQELNALMDRNFTQFELLSKLQSVADARGTNIDAGLSIVSLIGQATFTQINNLQLRADKLIQSNKRIDNGELNQLQQEYRDTKKQLEAAEKQLNQKPDANVQNRVHELEAKIGDLLPKIQDLQQYNNGNRQNDVVEAKQIFNQLEQFKGNRQVRVDKINNVFGQIVQAQTQKSIFIERKRNLNEEMAKTVGNKPNLTTSKNPNTTPTNAPKRTAQQTPSQDEQEQTAYKRPTNKPKQA